MRTLRRAAAAVAGAVALLAALAALPATLVMLQRSVELDWAQLAAQPLSAAGALVAAIGAGWVVWLALVWTVVRDAAAAVRGAPARLPVPLHTAVTAVAGGMVLALEAARGGAATVVQAPPTAVATAVLPPADAPPPHNLASTVDTESAAVGGWLQVPGGWLPVSVAAALAAAVTAAWDRHRQRYQPRSPAGWSRHDPDLPAPGRSVQGLLRAVRAADDAGVDAAPAWSGSNDDAVGEGLDRLRSVLELLPDGGLGLVGPGGHDAARGLLVTVAAHPATRRPPYGVTPDCGMTLLGTDRLPPPPPAGDTPAPPDSTPAFNEQAAHDATQHGARPGRANVVVFAVGPELSDNAATGTASSHTSAASGPSLAVSTSRRHVVQLTAAAETCWQVTGTGTAAAITGTPPPVDRLPMLNRTTALDLLSALGVLPAPGTAAVTPPVPAEPTGGSTEMLETWPDPPPRTAEQPRRLLIRLFGTPEVLRPHPAGPATPVTIRRTDGRQLLVLLALHRDGISADDLKEAVWPDIPRTAAHRRFLTNLSELRRTLHHAAGQPVLRQDDPASFPDGATSVLHRLDPAAVQVDVWQLQDRIDAAATTIDPSRRHTLLTDAAHLAGAELAAGWQHEWLVAGRERIARHLIDIHAHLADTAPDHDTALQHLHHALTLAPANEAIHRRILDRHAAAGDDDGLHRAVAALAEHLTARQQQPEPATAELINALRHAADQRRGPGHPTTYPHVERDST